MGSSTSEFIYAIKAQYQGTGEIKKLGDDLRNISTIKAFDKVQADAEKMEAALDKAEAKAAALKSEMEKTGTAAATSAYAKAEADVTKLSAAYSAQNIKLEQYAASLKAAGISTTELAAAQKTLEASALGKGGILAAESTLGIRSFATIKAEIAGLEQAYATLAASGTKSDAELARAHEALAAKTTALNAEMMASTAALTGQKTIMAELGAAAQGYSGGIASIIAVLGGISLFQKMQESVFSFNSTIEQSQIGLAALVRTFSSSDSAGKTFEGSMQIAVGIQKQLQIEGLKTRATYQQLLVALQEGIGPAMKAGFNPQQIVQFTSLMTQAAAAISLPMDQLGQELRAILSGTIDRNARIAMALGLTNAKVKELAASGKLFDFLKVKLQEFGSAGEAMSRTWAGAVSNMADAAQNILGKSFEGTYQEVTKLVLRIQQTMVSINNAGSDFTLNPKIMAAFKELDDLLAGFLNSGSSADLEKWMVSLAETVSKVGSTLVEFGGAAKTAFEPLLPYLPTIAELVTKLLLLKLTMATLQGAFLMPVAGVMNLYGALLKLGGVNLAAFASTTAGAMKTIELSALGIRGSLGLAAMSLTSFGAGWGVGTILRKFDTINKAGVILAEGTHLLAINMARAWAIISGGDTSKLTAEYNNVLKVYGEMYNQIGRGAEVSQQKTIAAAKNSGDAQKTKIVEVTKEIEDQYKKMAENIKSIYDQIGQNNFDIAASIREVQRSSMTEGNAWLDLRNQANEYAAAAQEAARAGNFQQANTYMQQAVSTAKSLSNEVTVNGEKMTARNAKIKELNDLNNQANEILSQQAEKEKEAAAALDKSTGGELAKQLPEVAKVIGDVKTKADELSGAMEPEYLYHYSKSLAALKGIQEEQNKLPDGAAAYNEKWQAAWSSFLETGSNDIASLNNQLNEFTKDRKITVHVTTDNATGYANGGQVLGLAGGGSVWQQFQRLSSPHITSGSGRRDDVPALLWRDEFVEPPWATKYYGVDFMESLRNLSFPRELAVSWKNLPVRRFSLGGIVTDSIRHFANGGPVIASSSGGGSVINNYSITVNVPAGASSSTQANANAIAKTVMAELQRMNKRRS